MEAILVSLSQHLRNSAAIGIFGCGWAKLTHDDVALAGLSAKRKCIANVLFDIASYFCAVFDLYYS